MTYNLFGSGEEAGQRPGRPGDLRHAGATRGARSQRQGRAQAYPTMEGLFGSMDFCECEHCRSVLSPAAYLVDLLQFVEAEPQARGNFLADWKRNDNGQRSTAAGYLRPYDALIERRPDLPHIPLTCENTNTALPYIDIVNEILEYYVAHNGLSRSARRTPATPRAPSCWPSRRT